MNTIKKQFEDMLARGVMPIIELELADGEYLLVNLDVTDSGVEFSFDSGGLPVSFYGDIETIHSNRYLLPLDSYVDSLDSYFETINGNLYEGFILPNGLIGEQHAHKHRKSSCIQS